jgi:hypothetical protein
MRTLQWAALLAACTLAACTDTPAPQPVAERNWEGELRILPGDSLFIPCGSTTHFRLTGPGLDSIAHRYAFLYTQPGQWIKTWCSGHAIAGKGAHGDSILVCASYMHMDPNVHCPPAPVDSLSGTYVAKSTMVGGAHTETLVFLPDGEATIISTAPGLYAEVDGRWGINANGSTLFQEANNRYSFEYHWHRGKLLRAMPGRNDSVAYQRTGPAERLTGAFGRTARWLASAATAGGNPVQPENLRPYTSLDSLFPDVEVRQAIRSSARDSLGLDDKGLVNVWDAASTVQDVTLLMRSRIQSGH